jgi:hypothetical protein
MIEMTATLWQEGDEIGRRSRAGRTPRAARLI